MVSLFMLIVSAAKWLRVDGNPARLSDYLTSSHGVALTTLLDNPFANELIASVIIFSGYQLLTLYDVWKRRSSAQHTSACTICTYMLVVTLPLFQIKDVRTQLLLRYISWFFTFSSVLQTHYVVASPRHISYGSSFFSMLEQPMRSQPGPYWWPTQFASRGSDLASEYRYRSEHRRVLA